VPVREECPGVPEISWKRQCKKDGGGETSESQIVSTVRENVWKKPGEIQDRVMTQVGNKTGSTGRDGHNTLVSKIPGHGDFIVTVPRAQFLPNTHTDTWYTVSINL
jgi:hypothetical protein